MRATFTILTCISWDWVPWLALSRWTCPSPSPSWWTWRRSSPQCLAGRSPRTGSWRGPTPPPPWGHMGQSWWNTTEQCDPTKNHRIACVSLTSAGFGYPLRRHLSSSCEGWEQQDGYGASTQRWERRNCDQLNEGFLTCLRSLAVRWEPCWTCVS